MLRIYRIVSAVILSIFIMLSVPAVQSQGQGNNSEPTHAIPAELPSLPPMAHQPPANAGNLDDFIPPGANVIPVDIELPGGPITPPGPPNPPPVPTINPPGPPITLPVTIPFNGLGTNVVSFDEGQLAVVIEQNTMAANSDLLFTVQPVPNYPLTATNSISNPVDSLHLLHFQLDMLQNGVPANHFAKPVRIVLDMRSLTGDLNPVYDGNYFLAYEDENEPGLWHDVPITVHQESGLISAEVSHFSTWVGGSRPERWNPSFVPATVSEFSGAATYNYPIDVPPGRHGLQPAVSLSYNSRSLDGAIQNIEAGDIANGWSLAQIAIMREEVTVKGDGAHLFIYHNDEFSLVLNGTSHKLEASGDSIANGTIRFYAKDAPGLKVWRYFDSSLSTDGFYWVVTTADGVQYRLGYTIDAEEYQQGDLWTTPSPTHWGKSNNRSAIAWNVDTVTDPYGNQMQYDYLTDTETETVEDSNDSINVTTRSSRLWRISYNYPNRVTSLPAANNVSRLTSTPATTIELRATSDNISAETFTDPISHILLFHNNASNPIKEYRLTHDPQSVSSSGCSRPQGTPRNTTTHVITDIRQHTNTDGDVNTNDMGYALPPVTFDYTSKVHFVDGNQSCFYFRYLWHVYNGYGGTTTFAYDSDNRDVGDYNYYGGTDTTEWPAMGYSYYVSEVRQNDGRNADVRTTYDYTSPCYNQWNTSVAVCSLPGAPEHGKLVGFATTTQTHYDYNGSTVLNKQITTFSQNAATTIGRPTRVDLKNSSNTLLSRTDTSYSTQSIGGIVNMFTYVSQTSSTQYENGTGSATLSSKVVYSYDTAHQGSTQYGNLTHIYEYDDANASTPYRTTRRWYYPNSSGNNWLVNRVGAEGVYEDGGWTQLGVTWTYYDGNSSHQTAPSKGSPTRVRQFLTDNDNCNQISSPPSGCTYLYLTAESSFAYDSYGNQTHRYGSNEYGYQAFNSSWALLAGAAPATETTNPNYL